MRARGAIITAALCASACSAADDRPSTTANSERTTSTTAISTTSVPTIPVSTTADLAPPISQPSEAGDATIQTRDSATFGSAPAVPIGPVDEAQAALIDDAIQAVAAKLYEPSVTIDPAKIAPLVAVDDIRLGWIIADLLQFVFRGEEAEVLWDVAGDLVDEDFGVRTAWKGLSDRLIAWNIPAPDGYEEWKADLLVPLEVTWFHFFDDADADIDWRHVSFGGVLADRRSFDSDESCACIRAMDDAPTTSAADGDWYPDHRLVFGLEVNGEHRAYAKNVMEVHELANDTIGGERISLTYCTLCGSAVAFSLEDLPADVERTPVLRTSGLLQRSNKIVFDLYSFSAIDQFTGRALSGPLREADVRLQPIPVTTSTWGEWKRAHPDTTFNAGDDGAAPEYPLDPLGERDAAGPIFPIGDPDATLFASQEVVGIDGSTGPAAFEVKAARKMLEDGAPVEAFGVELRLDGSGLAAFDLETGERIAAHQARWFAWSQFNPDTELWPDS